MKSIRTLYGILILTALMSSSVLGQETCREACQASEGFVQAVENRDSAQAAFDDDPSDYNLYVLNYNWISLKSYQLECLIRCGEISVSSKAECQGLFDKMYHKFVVDLQNSPAYSSLLAHLLFYFQTWFGCNDLVIPG